MNGRPPSWRRTEAKKSAPGPGTNSPSSAVSLPEEEELPELVLGHGVGQLAAGGSQRLGPAMPQCLGPLLPALPAATLLDRHEQGEVVQPGLLGGERLELLPQPVGSPRAETLP